MLELHYRIDDYDTIRTFTTSLDQIAIGTDPSCDLRLHGLAPIHCRLWRDDARWVVGPVGQVALNGVEISGPTYVGADDRLQLGSIALQVKPVVVEESEQALIEAARDDLVGREVYADWLEERAQWDRAEFLRLTVAAAGMEPEDPRFVETTTRIQNLAPCLDVAWRMQLASSEVEGCERLKREFTCNMTWDKLAPTDDPLVRTCGSCSSSVHYCGTEEEAIAHASRGHCMVIDVSVDRLAIRTTAQFGIPETPLASPPPPIMPPGMYMPPSFHAARPCPICRIVVPGGPGYRFCPQCGTPV